MCVRVQRFLRGDKRVFPAAEKQDEWYKSLIAQNQERKDTICEETKAIISECKTDKEKIAAIYKWVQENIRYISFEDGIAGFRPQVAHQVLDNKYGDCKGMANLLSKMLGCAGIDARMVWLGTKDIPYSYRTPSLAVDNHAVCAAIVGKDTIYLDATCKYLPLGVYPSSVAGRETMVENGNSCILTRVPDVTVDSVALKVSVKDGKFTGIYKNLFGGEIKANLISALEDNEGKLSNTLLSAGFKGLPEKENEIKISGLSPSYPIFSIEYPFESRSGLNLTGEKYYISIDFDKSMMNFDINVYIDDAKRVSRRSPTIRSQCLYRRPYGSLPKVTDTIVSQTNNTHKKKKKKRS